jgi:hypothetical protein
LTFNVQDPAKMMEMMADPDVARFFEKIQGAMGGIPGMGGGGMGGMGGMGGGSPNPFGAAPVGFGAPVPAFAVAAPGVPQQQQQQPQQQQQMGGGGVMDMGAMMQQMQVSR